jgi:hypothetical protein
MDHAVALVQAYLQVNGYFTVTEFPVLDASSHGYRTATDLDILAFRFAGAGPLVPPLPAARGKTAPVAGPDPALGITAGEPDMLIGEVKEGRAALNPAARDPAVLRAALTRFGCCASHAAGAVVEELLRHGEATTPCGHRVRLVAFGSTTSPDTRSCTVVSMGHVVQYLQEYLRSHWEAVGHTELKDPALGFLTLLEKARQGSPTSAESSPIAAMSASGVR